MSEKTISVLGAGYVAKPAIDYFLDTCGYRVVVTSLDRSDADRLVAGREAGRTLAWDISQIEQLDELVVESDLILSMLPPHLHLEVARACLRHRTNMVTTSYISTGMSELHSRCLDQEIIILNEIGEDPGLDLMITKQMIDQVHQDQGRVVQVASYGAGLPSFCCNNNPFGYKFSWSPRGLLTAARTSAAYMVSGRRVEVSGQDLFTHFKLVDLQDIGTFETYPNRDAEQYLESFNLDRDASLYRGLLRFPGYCNTMSCLASLGYFNLDERRSFQGMSYGDLLRELLGNQKHDPLEKQVADYLKVPVNSDIVHKICWLGLLDEEPIRVSEGSPGDVLLERMTEKMKYSPLEQDMVILYTELIADFKTHKERHIASLVLEGEPGGDTAMSRSVSLPAAIAAKRIVEESIPLHGVLRPTDRLIYQPVLEELEKYGYQFSAIRKRE